jgi:hypothetical protein
MKEELVFLLETPPKLAWLDDRHTLFVEHIRGGRAWNRLRDRRSRRLGFPDHRFDCGGMLLLWRMVFAQQMEDSSMGALQVARRAGQWIGPEILVGKRRCHGNVPLMY